jgi:asparagine synthase (glutamine-hydrolysing)
VAGIAGILGLAGAPLDPAAAAIADAMGEQIAHRGLAARRVERQGPLALVLAAGPAPGGAAAPLYALDGAPRGREQDLASLYARAGPGFPSEIDGSFAVALWDAARERLILARDRAGVRPLFYAVVGSGDRRALIFASEVKALLAHPDCPREVDWLRTLAEEALPARALPRTSFFHGIDDLAPGTLLEFDARAGYLASARRYWSLAPLGEAEYAADRRSDAAITAEFRAALDAAVARSLAGRARPGILLSGGIDSVSVAAIAARGRRLPSFTVLSQSTFGNGDAGFAREAAEHLRLPHHQVLFRWHESALTPERWRKLLWTVETPFCKAQHFYKHELCRFAAAVEPGLDVMLNGEGSDEFIGADFANQGEERPGAGCDDYFEELLRFQRVDQLTLEALGVESWLGRPIFSRSFLARTSARPLPAHPWHRRFEYCLEGFASNVGWRDDRIAAANGMASEAPFMDHRLLEVIARIPPRAYPSLFWKKRMLREAMAPELPEAVRWRRKIPFYCGVDVRYTSRMLLDVLLAEGGALLREAFGEGEHAVLAPGVVEGLLEESRRDPECSAVEALLLLTNLGLLEALAKDTAAAARRRALEEPPLEAIDVADEARVARLLATRRAEVSLDRAIAFAGNAYLVRPDRAGAAEGPSYIVVDDEVRYVLEGDETREWREVLRRIDGARPLRAILAEVGVAEGAIRKHLEEALDFEVLVLAEGPARA